MPLRNNSEPAAPGPPSPRRSLDDANSSEEETREQIQDKADDALLRTIGISLLLENFSTTFAALYFVGGTTYITTCVFTFITAAVIAETCSSLPSAASIYRWAAEAGGPKYGRLMGFIVATWSTTAWTTFCASKGIPLG
ncbi:hypothetical protein DL95DRAFT_458807 [Leptodontidium sp. 2 PMI_412]|nr:hypothetical protein DL95DRAFT_458807 [Leptodontidium sp. 2 PMI_412]